MTLEELRNKITANTRVHVTNYENANYTGWYAVTMIRPEYLALAMRDNGLPLGLTWPVGGHYWMNGTSLHVPDKSGENVAALYNFNI
jgi:hypothetical protein